MSVLMKDFHTVQWWTFDRRNLWRLLVSQLTNSIHANVRVHFINTVQHMRVSPLVADPSQCNTTSVNNIHTNLKWPFWHVFLCLFSVGGINRTKGHDCYVSLQIYFPAAQKQVKYCICYIFTVSKSKMCQQGGKVLLFVYGINPEAILLTPMHYMWFFQL